MAASRLIRRIDAAIWALIFGGLFTLVLGIVTQEADAPLGWVLIAVGALAAAAGVVLVWVRSRMREDTEPASPDNSKATP